MKHRQPPKYEFPTVLGNFAHMRTLPVTTLVLHSTEGASAESSIAVLQERHLSYHYMIERDGTLYRLVEPIHKVAWHAGLSLGPGGASVNNYSVGVCFACRDDGKDPFTDEAVETLNWLIERLRDIFPTLKYITTHYWISPGRKTDPAHLDLSKVDTDGLTWWKGK